MSQEESDKRIEQKKFQLSEFSIFAPKSKRALYIDYPELKSYPQFKDLRVHEMLFVWYYACEASPFFHLNDDFIRSKKAADKSCMTSGGKLSISGPEYKSLIDCRFPAKIERAITVMQKFKVGPRIRAKMMFEKTLENIEKILNVDASDTSQFLNKDDEVDWSKKKAFVDTITSATANIPKLVSQLEDNFAVTGKYDSDETDEGTDGMSFADDFHEQN
jgi:hypothetical protein